MINSNTSYMLRLPDVMKVTGLSRSSLYALIKQGQFPRQIQLGPRAVAWLSSDVESWLEERINAARNMKTA
ncbi:helix-turn-helix transcriptional regulator [Chromobacterium vaccinii]|uniref:helix-turn-helix transcriptional regulator n=1 Tax=Chromobacterium vaccinii TaxID=1108595 RepID=UPI000E153DE1|nr:AlpA family transcriptional regulator [Chromobacterium vaccinii]SUX28441.1 Predicted transcriptional regulator [Chromobacterium vaccinii]